jgi:hypothetical protein
VQDRAGSLRQLQTFAAVASAVLLAGVAVTGALLTWRYRPGGAWFMYERTNGVMTGTLSSNPPPGTGASHQLVGRHQVALVLSIVATLAWGVTSMLLVARVRPSRLRARVVAVSSGLLALLSWFSWRLVKWDQVAFMAVTVGGDVRGLWSVAFDRGIGFVVVGGSEVSRSTFALWVLVHLVAPVLALALLAMGWRSSRRLIRDPIDPPVGALA